MTAELLAPPPDESELQASNPEAPAMRRGFLLDEPQPMAGQKGLIYPVDDETGLPHLVRVFDYHSNGSPVSAEMNYDHSWFHERSTQLRGLGGRAVRLSMGQMIPVSIHIAKNKRFDRLSWLPGTDDKKFEALIKSITGVVSPWAVDVRRAEDDLLVRLDGTELSRLTHSSRFFREKAHKDKQSNYRRSDIGEFIVRYSIDQNLREMVSDNLVDEFLHTEDDVRRKEIGNTILKHAVMERVDPLMNLHANYKKKGMVRPDAPAPIVAVRKILEKHRFKRYYPALAEKLLAA